MQNDTQHIDTQHIDTQHCDTQHSGTQHDETKHNDTQHMTLSIMTLSMMIFNINYSQVLNEYAVTESQGATKFPSNVVQWIKHYLMMMSFN
jgi:hypothetical protein